MIEIRNGLYAGEPIAWLPNQYGGRVYVFSRAQLPEAVEAAIGPAPTSPVVFRAGELVVLASPFNVQPGGAQTPVTIYDQSEDQYNAARQKKYEDDCKAWSDWRDYVIGLAKLVDANLPKS